MTVIEHPEGRSEHVRGLIDGLHAEAKQHKDAYLAMREENEIIRQQLRGAVNLLREARALFQEDGTENGVDRRFIEGFKNLGAAIRLLEGGQ